MKLTYFVNAMILIEGASTRVLCDPWITFDERSRSGLYNFPPTGMTRKDVADLRPDYLYVTHTHADHFDPTTLKLFDKETPCLVADFANNFTARRLAMVGFTDIRVVDHDRGISLGGDDWAWIQPSATYPEVDSVAGFRIDGETVFNANDNPFHEGQCRDFRKLMGDISLCCVPFAFQGPYPAFYENLSEEKRVSEARAKKERNYAHVANYARTLDARRLFAFAAGALYGGKKALLYPYYGVGNAEEAIAHASQAASFEPVLLSSGMSIELPSGKITGTYEERTHERELDYIRRISETTGPFDEGGLFWVAPSERVDLTPLLVKARERQDLWATRTGRSTDFTFYIDVGEETLYRMRINEPEVTRVREQDIADEPYEIFRVPYPLMVGLLARHYNWSNVKTQFMSFKRQPNTFDASLHILMSYLQL